MVCHSGNLVGRVILPLFVATIQPSYAEAAPTISKVRLLQKQDGVTAKIFGAHFGKSPVKLPCEKCNINEL
jgi:hypothetical protein